MNTFAASGAICEVAAAMERKVEEGHRAAQIDAHDLIEVLLAVGR